MSSKRRNNFGVRRKVRKRNNNIYVYLINLHFYRKRSKVFMSPDWDQIKIVPLSYDSHYLILELDKNLNVSVSTHSLPDNEKYFKPLGTIQTHAATYFELLKQTEEFYAQMNTIDELTCVVDPEEITTKHNHRVIKLEDRVYMKIKVNPLELSSVTTKFYGTTKKVERYRQIYHEKLDEWNVNDDIYRNFLRIFGTIKTIFILYPMF